MHEPAPKRPATTTEPGPGPLPDDVRTKMERSFDTSFADVRVHIDAGPARLGGQAHAVGSDLTFTPGRYEPHTAAGQELIGHELAHVVQQRRGDGPAVQGKGFAFESAPALEREADDAGARAARGERVHIGGAARTADSGLSLPFLAKLDHGKSYDAVAQVDCYDDAGGKAQLPIGQGFDCIGPLQPIPATTLNGYPVRSMGRKYFVSEAVANVVDDSIWKTRAALAPPPANNANAVINNWDVGHGGGGRDKGGHMVGFGDAAVNLQTSVKWGPLVAGPKVPEASWMEATILGPDHPAGSTNQVRENSQALTEATGGKLYVGGHLLNDHVGGSGTDPRNIAAIPEWNTNTLHESQVESKVKTHVNERGGWAYYRVDVDHADKDLPVGKTINGKNKVPVATAFKTRWHPLDASGAQAGSTEVAELPIPSPRELPTVSTDPDNQAKWFDQKAAIPAVNPQPEARSQIVIGHPLQQPLTGHLEDYGGQGLTAAPTSYPHHEYASPTRLAEFVKANIIATVGRSKLGMMKKTQSIALVVDNQTAFRGDTRKRENTEPVQLIKKAAKQRPAKKETEVVSELTKHATDMLVQYIAQHPNGQTMVLAKGWWLAKQLGRGLDDQLKADPAYQAWTQFNGVDFTSWLEEDAQAALRALLFGPDEEVEEGTGKEETASPKKKDDEDKGGSGKGTGTGVGTSVASNVAVLG